MQTHNTLDSSWGSPGFLPVGTLFLFKPACVLLTVVVWHRLCASNFSSGSGGAVASQGADTLCLNCSPGQCCAYSVFLELGEH